MKEWQDNFHLPRVHYKMSNQKLVAVIDYGMGNLRSVFKAAEHVANNNTKIIVTNDAKTVKQADAIIFPGQGAARACMNALTETNMTQAIKQAAQEKPFLGICMGLQILMTHSDENEGVECLSILPGLVKKFDISTSPNLKLPHMGWNEIHQKTEHPLWHNIAQDNRFYFVHSYHVKPDDPSSITGKTTHGIEFNACLAHKNVFAIQAHPEKSAQAGLQLIENFLTWNGH